MEVTLACWVSLSLVLVSITLRWAWSVLDWVWLKPKKLERCLREQGLQGNSYKFLYGDVKEDSILLKHAKSKPMNLSTCHDIAPRLIPLLDQTVKTYGKNSFVWSGPVPTVTIMNPEDVKDVFTKLDDFLKPVSNPLLNFLITGLISYEGEKWAKRRRIINPTFHVEKLKQMLPAFHKSCDEMIKEWESLASKEGSSCLLDVWPSLQQLTADVISRTSFGSSYQEGRKMFELLKEQVMLVANAIQSVYIPGWRFLPTNMNKRMKKIDKEVTMIFHEVLRLYPPVDMISRTTHKKTQLGKFSLPAGVQVDLPTVLIHRDKELWGDDANEFNPERFSEGVSKATKSQLSFIPFRGGPRICIGQNFAMIEAKLALSLILLHFDFELSPSYAHAPSAPMI